MKKRVLLLGAAGKVGKGFVDEYTKNYKSSYELVLGVHNKKFKSQEFKVKYISLEDLGSLKRAMKGISVVVNMAANPEPKANFEDLIKPNLIGAYNVFEAARLSRVFRVIFASSIHAIKDYPDGYKILSTDAPKPQNFYGATKAFGEALCNVFSSKYGLSCLAIRIGAYVSNDQKDIICRNRANFDYVISQSDMGQLIHKSIQAPKSVKYGILSGTSKTKAQRMSLALTKKLVGYSPKNNSAPMCSLLRKRFKSKRRKKI